MRKHSDQRVTAPSSNWSAKSASPKRGSGGHISGMSKDADEKEAAGTGASLSTASLFVSWALSGEPAQDLVPEWDIQNTFQVFPNILAVVDWGDERAPVAPLGTTGRITTWDARTEWGRGVPVR